MTSVPPALQPLLSSFRQLLERRFGDRLLDVRLYGSWARGDADDDSDVDVAVVVAGLTDAERSDAIDLAFAAWRSAGPDGPLIDPLVWSDTHRADRLAAERRLALDVEREGIPA